MDPANVNICFSTTNGLGSRLIRWVTRSTVSHALITYRDDTLDKVLVLEATGRGFNVIPWARWRTHSRLVARFCSYLPGEVQLAALRKLTDLLGEEYDYVSLIGFAWRRWTKRYHNPLASARKLICSEVVAIYLKALGASIVDPADFTPQDLYALLRGSSAFRQVE